MEAGVCFGVAVVGRRMSELLAAFKRTAAKPAPVKPARFTARQLQRAMTRAEANERLDKIKREVQIERRQREFEQRVAILARARGEELSPVPQSGAAVEMAKHLVGQALFDSKVAKILENLGLNPSGRNRSWKGPVHSENADAELDRPEKKALDQGWREKTAAPRIRR